MGKPLRVLIVEDSEDDAEMVLRQLKRNGYDPYYTRVETAETMSDALKQGPWDIVLSDYSMPQFSAPAALALLKKSGLDLPFIIVSGTIGEETAVEAMKTGANDYLIKGNLTRLVPAIERELREVKARSERRQTEDALMKLRKAVETSGEVIFLTDKDGLITYVNPEFSRLYGYSADEVVGKCTPRVLKSGRMMPDDYTLFWKGLLDRHVQNGEIVNKTKDGKYIVVNSSASPIQDEKENIIGFLAIQRDVTERKKAEEELRRSNKELSALHTVDKAVSEILEINEILNVAVHQIMEILDADSVGIYLFQEDGKRMVLAAHGGLSDRLVDIFREVHVDQSISGLVAAGKGPILMRSSEHPSPEMASIIVSEGFQWLLGVPLLSKDRVVGSILAGTRKPHEFETTQINTLLSIGINLGIALHNARLYEELQRSEVRYRRLVEFSPDMIAVQSEGKIVYMNPAGLRILGAEKLEQVIGKPVLDFVHPSYWELVKGRIHRLEQGGEVTLAEEKHLRLDGTAVDVEVAAIPFVYDNKIAVQVVVRNITEQKRLEAQLLQTQKIEAIGQLAGGVAHDFNNILMGISGYSEILLLKLGENHPLSRDVLEIRKGAERGSSLTHQLLAFSRKQVLEPKVLDLNDVLAGMDNLLRRLIREDIELAFIPAKELGRVKADSGQMEQVVMNLAVNARDAMPQRGKLIIETANVQLTQECSGCDAPIPPGRYVRLSVSDTGCGMDEATRSRIFEPFFTTKEKGKGTGLGLATVYGIVKQSEGYICVETEPSKGTTFHICLPRIDSPVEAIASLDMIRLSPAGSETILLVDDNESVRVAVGALLQMKGYKVLEATHGREALEISRRYKDQIHLLATDMVMPQMNGVELAQTLKADRPGLKVLLMSGYSEEAMKHQGHLGPGIAFLQKPASMPALLAKIRELLT